MAATAPTYLGATDEIHSLDPAYEYLNYAVRRQYLRQIRHHAADAEKVVGEETLQTRVACLLHEISLQASNQ